MPSRQRALVWNATSLRIPMYIQFQVCTSLHFRSLRKRFGYETRRGNPAFTSAALSRLEKRLHTPVQSVNIQTFQVWVGFRGSANLRGDAIETPGGRQASDDPGAALSSRDSLSTDHRHWTSRVRQNHPAQSDRRLARGRIPGSDSGWMVALPNLGFPTTASAPGPSFPGYVRSLNGFRRGMARQLP